MAEMDRRTFLLSTGRWLAVAALAPTLSGCSHLLRGSDSEGGAEGGETDSGDGAASTPTTSQGGSTSTTTSSSAPDLAVIKGDSPDLNVRAAIAQLGGMERFVKPNAKVIVKPNVLTGRPPEYAVCTNPIVIGTIVRMCFEAGAATVTVLDHTTSNPRSDFEVSGLAQATKEAGGTLKLLSSRDYETMQIPGGQVLKACPLVADVFEADTFINVPICKVHNAAGLTLSMKNLMGIIGTGRANIHRKMAAKLTDLSTLVKPQLIVLDAYRCLVRNGPGGGRLKDVVLGKTCVAGTDPVVVDSYGCKIMGWQPMDLPALAEATKRGLGDPDLSHHVVFEGTA